MARDDGLLGCCLHHTGRHRLRDPLTLRLPGRALRDRLRAGLSASPRVRSAVATAREHAGEAALPFQAELRRRIAEILEPRATAITEARHEADQLAAALRRAEPRAAAAIARLDRSPFTAATTVHAAHARHPGVQAIFARHGLPRCTDCAVGADETLAEAAFGESLPLDALLAELEALRLS